MAARLRAEFQELHDKYLDTQTLRALAASQHVRRITRLNLDHAKLGDAGPSLLAESPNLAQLASLSLRFTEMGPAGLLALARSPHLKSLRTLDVRANDLLRNAPGATWRRAGCSWIAVKLGPWDRP